MRFSRQEYWSGWPFPSLGDLPNPGIEPRSPALYAGLYHLSHHGSPTNLKPDINNIKIVRDFNSPLSAIDNLDKISKVTMDLIGE